MLDFKQKSLNFLLKNSEPSSACILKGFLPEFFKIIWKAVKTVVASLLSIGIAHAYFENASIHVRINL